MIHIRHILVIAALALTGCGAYPTIPDLGLATPDKNADLPWPQLRPTKELSAHGKIDIKSTIRGADTLAARAAALKARGKRLQRPLIDTHTKARMLRLMRSS